MGKVFFLCLALLVVFLALSPSTKIFDYTFRRVLVSMDRPSLAILKLTNFVVNLYVVVYLCCVGEKSKYRWIRSVSWFLTYLITLKPLVFLGQHSLQVFAFHIVAIYIVLAIIGDPAEVPLVMRVAVYLAAMCSLFLPAAIHAGYQRTKAKLKHT